MKGVETIKEHLIRNWKTILIFDLVFWIIILIIVFAFYLK